MTDPAILNQLPYTDILDNIDVGIALYDKDGNYRYVNTALITTSWVFWMSAYSIW